jgi:hypothetical protein
MAKAKFRYEVKRKSDTEAVVKFPSGIKVGKNIAADKLLIALLKAPPASEVQGQCGDLACCGDNGCCVKLWR